MWIASCTHVRAEQSRRNCISVFSFESSNIAWRIILVIWSSADTLLARERIVWQHCARDVRECQGHYFLHIGEEDNFLSCSSSNVWQGSHSDIFQTASLPGWQPYLFQMGWSQLKSTLGEEMRETLLLDGNRRGMEVWRLQVEAALPSSFGHGAWRGSWSYTLWEGSQEERLGWADHTGGRFRGFGGTKTWLRLCRTQEWILPSYKGWIQGVVLSFQIMIVGVGEGVLYQEVSQQESKWLIAGSFGSVSGGRGVCRVLSSRWYSTQAR